jgi:hypothetical protein
MRIIKNVVIGGLVMFVGFMLYPPYINYIYTPVYNMVVATFPDPPAEQMLFWKVFPFVILVGVIGYGIMWFIGRKNLPEGGETGANTEGK